MPKVILLGTGGAVTTPDRTTTMLAFVDEGSTVLVDCGGDVIQRCLAANITLDEINAMIVSHEHPDHTSGFPLFMGKIWLHGRRRPIRVIGLPNAIEHTKQVFSLYKPSTWKGLPHIEWEVTSLEINSSVYSDARWKIVSAPGSHTVPVVGFRVVSLSTGTSVCYSCDTERDPVITELARECDVLVHEANGTGPGHSSAQDAARVAAEAKAGKLFLTHISQSISEDDIREARSIFPHTYVGRDLDEIEL